MRTYDDDQTRKDVEQQVLESGDRVKIDRNPTHMHWTSRLVGREATVRKVKPALAKDEVQATSIPFRGIGPRVLIELDDGDSIWILSHNLEKISGKADQESETGV